MDREGGNRRTARRFRAGTLALVGALLGAALAGCGGDSDDSDEKQATYEASVVSAELPRRQRLGETTQMRLKVRNDDEETIPALVVNVTLGGEAGAGSAIPFGVRSSEPGLAQPERPVWVLEEHYPKRAGSEEPGGTEGASPKSFNFGSLPAGETLDAVWKLTAVKEGRFRVLFDIDADASGKARAVSPGGGEPRGSFAVTITDQVPDTTVNDRGEVVEIRERKGRGG